MSDGISDGFPFARPREEPLPREELVRLIGKLNLTALAAQAERDRYRIKAESLDAKLDQTEKVIDLCHDALKELVAVVRDPQFGVWLNRDNLIKIEKADDLVRLIECTPRHEKP